MCANLFNENLVLEWIEKFPLTFTEKEILHKKSIVSKWVNRIEDGTLIFLKEEQLQGEFVRDFFSDVLGAKHYFEDTEEWNVSREEKTISDSTKADAVLGYFNNSNKDYRVAIELKGPRVKLDLKQNRNSDKRTPIEQGFSYLPKYGKKCNWLILSNYREIRLYHYSDSSDFISFNIVDLVDENIFVKFLFILYFGNMISKTDKSLIDRMLEVNFEKEKVIEANFYKLYSETRVRLFNIIQLHNEDLDKLLILEKTQKLLDRFIFVCFIEDKRLVPTNIFTTAVEKGKESFSEFGVWESVRGLFLAIDQGNKFREINKFNGGLFKKDILLDELVIPNGAFDTLVEIAAFDFNSDLNVNILGHIFEQSISDLEDLKKIILGIEDKKSKRKKEGIFYTPADMTRFIIENTIGTYLSRIRENLGEGVLPNLTEKDLKPKFDKKLNRKYSANLKKHIQFWEYYRDEVLKLKILDPACGSGAFLNQAFDYLYKVGQEINDTLEQYTGMPSLFDLDRSILQNNIYGVDLNPESIEITKLSLWLKTANKNKELTTLDDNIKCGNSLISSPEFKKSFDWKEEFKEIFEEGGFDLIIGNPPYVRYTELEEDEKNYYSTNYKSAVKQFDLYILFNELVLDLIKPNGIIGFIQPNKFLAADYGSMLLNILKESVVFHGIKNVSQAKVFKDASVYPYIFIYEKLNEIPENLINRDIDIFEFCTKEKLIGFETEVKSMDTVKKIEKYSITLGDYLDEITRGVPNSKLNLEGKKYKAIKSISLDQEFILKEDFQYIDYKTSKYELEKINEFSSSLIMLPRTVKTIRAVLKDDNVHILDRIYYFKLLESSPLTNEQVVALLNSSYISFYYNYKYGSTKIGGGYFDLKGNQIRMLPIPTEIKASHLKKLSDLHSKFIESYKELNSHIGQFNDRCRLNIKGSVPYLDKFYKLHFEGFLSELKKKKIKLALLDQDDWQSYFEVKKKQATIVNNKIIDLKKELDLITYDAFRLNKKDIAVIEEVIEGLNE